MTRTEFSAYVSASYAKLLRFVRSRIANPHDAEDVLQQTLLRLLPNCEALNVQAPDGFVFTALRNAIIDYWRHRGRQPPIGPLPEEVAASVGGPGPVGDAAAEHRCRHLLRQAAAELTPREQQAFAAYWRASGDRAAALEGLAVADSTSQDKYRVYDGPLYHAKRKLAHALKPAEPLLGELGPGRVWELIAEVWGAL
jgi:RNA polymerase sigma factor (sigma-70 family)